MALFENLAEGFANAAGATGAAQSIENVKSDRRATAHEELEGNTHAILEDVKRLQERRAALPPGSPEIADIDKSLGEHQRAFTDLYHPTKNPGALQHLGRFLEKHVARKEPAPLPQSNAVTPERMAGLQASAAGTAQPEVDAGEKLKKQYKALTGKDAPPEVLEQFARKQGGLAQEKEVPTKFATGLAETTDTSDGSKHYWRVPLETGAQPEEVDFHGQKVTPKAGAPKPVRAWVNRNGKITSVLLDPGTNKPIPGSENADILPPSSMTGRITTGFYHFVDDQGNVHQLQETRTSMPAGQGATPTPPKTPKEAKDRVAAVAPKDNVIGHKETTVQADAHKKYISAYQLSEAADKAANEPDNAQSQKSLAVALERAVAGRFTTQALDYILKAGWSAGAEQFWNNIDNGTLPTVVMKNLIQRAHDNKDSAYSAWQESRKGTGGGGGGGDAYIYAKDPRGQVHRAKKGTALPQGWTITNAPTAQ